MYKNKKTLSTPENVEPKRVKIPKRQWTNYEDEILKNLVEIYGSTNWAVIASHMDNRNRSQCRERWMNHLNPVVDTSSFTQEEQDRVVRLQSIMGNSWSEMAKIMKGRTGNAIKNCYNLITYRQKAIEKRNGKFSESNKKHKEDDKEITIHKLLKEDKKELWSFEKKSQDYNRHIDLDVRPLPCIKFLNEKVLPESSIKTETL